MLALLERVRAYEKRTVESSKSVSNCCRANAFRCCWIQARRFWSFLLWPDLAWITMILTRACPAEALSRASEPFRVCAA